MMICEWVTSDLDHEDKLKNISREILTRGEQSLTESLEKTHNPKPAKRKTSERRRLEAYLTVLLSIGVPVHSVRTRGDSEFEIDTMRDALTDDDGYVGWFDAQVEGDVE